MLDLSIVSSKVVDDAVNAQDKVSIGTEALQEHERQWPEGFRNTISKKVKTIADGKKFVSVRTEKVYDTTVIYSCVIGIQAISRELQAVAKRLKKNSLLLPKTHLPLHKKSLNDPPSPPPFFNVNTL